MGKHIDSYTSGWFRAKRRPGKEVPREVAKKDFELKRLYSAVIKDNGIYYCFIQHSNDFFYVGFLDSIQREYLKFLFRNSKEGSKFFLKEVQYWEYEGETDKKIQTDIYEFTENGDITIHKVNVQTREGTQFTSVEPFDIRGFYEDFPEFGEYDKLIRKDRIDGLTLSDDNFKPTG